MGDLGVFQANVWVTARGEAGAAKAEKAVRAPLPVVREHVLGVAVIRSDGAWRGDAKDA